MEPETGVYQSRDAVSHLHQCPVQWWLFSVVIGHRDLFLEKLCVDGLKPPSATNKSLCVGTSECFLLAAAES